MNATSADTIDFCPARLHDEGFSMGDMAVRATKGTMRVVFAKRGEERIVAKLTSPTVTEFVVSWFSTR